MKGRKAMPYKFIRGGIVTMLLAGLLAVAFVSSIADPGADEAVTGGVEGDGDIGVVAQPRLG